MIESEPTGNVVKLSVATPEPFTAPVPIEVVPFVKATVPVVTGIVAANTVTVNVTLAPYLFRPRQANFGFTSTRMA